MSERWDVPEPRTAPSVEVMVHAGVPRDAIDRPLGRLFLLLCERYDLDPALRQVEVIPTQSGPRVYITADGYRHIALASGQLDGLSIDSSEGGSGWRAHVVAWRKGCAHGFDGRAGCGFVEGKDDPEAQAITRATRRALRNAFDPIRVEPQYAELMRDSDTFDDDEDAPAPQHGRTDRPEASAAPGPVVNPQPSPVDPAGPGPGSAALDVEPEAVAPGDTYAAGGMTAALNDEARRQAFDDARQAAAREAFARLGEQSRRNFRRRHKIVAFDAPWPNGALHELLGPAPEVEQ